MAKPRRPAWRLLVGLIILAVISTACGGGSNGDSSSGKPTGPVTVWVGSWWQPQVPKIQAAWAKDHPDIKLDIQLLPINGYLDKTTSAILGGSGPDVVDLDATWISTLAAKNLLQPLDDDAKNLPEKDFAPSIWAASHYAGKTYAIPERGESQVLYYNKTMFDAAGVPYPTAGWTYQDLLADAQKLTIPGKQWGVGIAADASDPSNVLASFAPMLWASGGDFLNKDNTKAIINEPSGVQGITFWSELYTKYHVAPDGTPGYAGTRDLQPLFQNNKVAMYFSSSNTLSALDAVPGVKYGTVLEPNNTNVGGGYAFAIPTGAQHTAAAKEFVSWFVQPENMGSLLNRMPARISAQNTAPWNGPEYAALRAAVPYSRSIPSVPNFAQMENTIIAELQKVLTKQETPQQAADAMASKMNSLLSQK